MQVREAVWAESVGLKEGKPLSKERNVHKQSGLNVSPLCHLFDIQDVIQALQNKLKGSSQIEGFDSLYCTGLMQTATWAGSIDRKIGFPSVLLFPSASASSDELFLTLMYTHTDV